LISGTMILFLACIS